MTVRFLLVFMFYLVLHSGLVMQANLSQQIPKPNPALYDKAGPYSVGNELSPQARSKVVGEIRGFLWEHWKQRRLGQLSATFYTIEGDSTYSTFFIELDAKGYWRIRVKSESTISALLPKGRKPRREVTRNSYNSIERIEATSTSPDTSTPISEKDERQPDAYKLRLKNTLNSLVQIF